MDKAAPAPEGARSLIAHDRVVGTDVRRPDGTKVGRIERPMLDGTSGQVADAVASFGRVLGLGKGFHTLPWGMLRFSPEHDADVGDITEAQLRDAPPRSPAGTDPAEDRAWEEWVHRSDNPAPYRGL